MSARLGVAVGAADLRLTELVAAVSLATDLGTGQPIEHGLRTCLLSMAVVDELGLDSGIAADIFYVALLRFLGCTADAPETAQLAGGDNITFLSLMAPVTMGGIGEMAWTLVRGVGRDRRRLRRARLVAGALSDPKGAARSMSAHCEVGARLAARLGLGDGVVHALSQAYERWDGRGIPDGLAGEAIPMAVRVAVVARDAVLWQRLAGTDAAAEVLAARSGRAYDPAVVDAVRAVGVPASDGRSVWDDVLAAEPSPIRTIGPVAWIGRWRRLAISPIYGRGGRRAVRPGSVGWPAAGRQAGVPEAELKLLHRAGLVADIGAVGVPTAVWERFDPLAPLAGSHHERLNGSGYHRGSTSARSCRAWHGCSPRRTCGRR